MKTYKRTKLKNGLRILSSPIATESITLLVLVGAGSRYETKEINGISHFIEHMFFKGAERYKNTKEVSEKIDGVGGEFNAFTGKEYAGYYVKLAKEQMEVAFDVVSDMLIKPGFQPEEIDKERGVIMEEYNMYQDTPMYQIGWDFEKLMFGTYQPMGWDQVGTKELINSVTHEQFVSYHNQLYQPNNTVIAVSGNIEHQQVLNLVNKYFQFPDGKKTREWAKFEGYNSKQKVIMQEKKTEQAHLVIGFPGYHSTHKHFYAQKMLAIILGGNMSSRMFLNIREAKGLCYYIHTSTDDYHDCGTISTGAGVAVTKVEEAVTSIIEQYKIVKEERNITKEELQKAKNYVNGKLVISLEDSEKVAHMLGKREILDEGVRTIDEIKEMINAVTVTEVHRVANDLFIEEELRLAFIGPNQSEDKFKSLLHF
jgi:predicted Zn-dependent peptidase